MSPIFIIAVSFCLTSCQSYQIFGQPPSARSQDDCPFYSLSYVPVVLLGYDVVAYHLNVTGCGALMGNPCYTHQLTTKDETDIYREYEFWFADENNLNIFKKDPWKYAPKYGGFCSWGTCCELEEDGWPWTAEFIGPPAGPDEERCGMKVWEDGFLYFNIWSNPLPPAQNDYVATFFENAEANIAAADARWIDWYGSLQAGPFNTYCFSTTGHVTMYDCVDYAQRKALSIDPTTEIYPVSDWSDPYFWGKDQCVTPAPTSSSSSDSDEDISYFAAINHKIDNIIPKECMVWNDKYDVTIKLGDSKGFYTILIGIALFLFLYHAIVCIVVAHYKK